MSDVEDEIADGEITEVTFAPIADPRTDEFVPASRRLRPEFGADLAFGDDEFDEREVLRFLSELAEGYGENLIGLSLGWSPAKVKRFVTNPARREIIDAIAESLNESVEHAILRHARDGNSTAMKLWAFNRMQHRGWADKREVSHHVSGQAEIIQSVRIAMIEQTREMIGAGGQDAVAQLQAAFIDVVDADVVEAE